MFVNCLLKNDLNSSNILDLDVEKQLKQFFERPDVQRQMAELRAVRQAGIRSRTGEDGDRVEGLNLKDTRFMRELNSIFIRNKTIAFNMMQRENPELFADYQTSTRRRQRAASGDILGLAQYGKY